MDQETRDQKFIRKPIYPGGKKAYKDFIYGNLKYPKKALKDKVEGIVIIKYSINHKGKVHEAKVISSVGSGCDEEALRIVKLLKFEVPKGPRKLKVVFHRTVRIHFNLPPKKKKKVSKPVQSTQYNVVYTTSSEEKKAPKKTNEKVYRYTVQW